MELEAPLLDEMESAELAPAPEITVPSVDPAVREKQAAEMVKLIDLHLDYERQSRIPLSMDELTPRRLCPEQRVDLVTDLYAVTR